jgi:DNA excision repair protein ERCC-1
LSNFLSNIKSVNKTDVLTLASNYGVRPPDSRDKLNPVDETEQSFKAIATADPDSLVNLPGVGEKKVKRIREAFSTSFLVKAKKKKSNAEQRGEVGNQLN